MSTRGNYNFINRDYNQKDVMIYAHYDNYPEGAAGYIYNMLMYRRDRYDGFEYNIVTPETFLRANELAELTDDVHGDIEYYYEIDCKFSRIRAYEVSFDDGEKMLFFDGSIFEFVNQHIDNKLTPNFNRFHELSGSNDYCKFTNQQQAEAILKKLYEKLGKMTKWDNYQQNPNFISALAKTTELEKALEMMKGV